MKLQMLIPAIAVSLMTAIASAQIAPSPQGQRAMPKSAEDFQAATAHRRAVEAVIWGVPAVNYDLMLQAMLNTTAAKPNEIVYWSRPVSWKNQTLTPNPDAIYLMIFFNTREGPLVIDVPPADTGNFAANIDTVWQMPLEDAGLIGADQGKGGKYLILPPGYKDAPSADGYITVRSDTFGGYALFRSNLASHSEADIAKARDYGKRLKVYPLGQAKSPPETKFTDAMDVLFDSTIAFNLRFFESLDRIVQTEPWLTRDMAMIDQLKSIGIEKGKPFNPDEKTKRMLETAAIEARDYLDALYDEGFAPFWTTSRWAVPATQQHIKASSSGYTVSDLYPVDDRAITYSIGYIGIKRLGTAQFYLIASKDKDGAKLEGEKTYRLHVPANVPTKQYWSATVYDRQTHALIKNVDRASRASNSTDVRKSDDGSTEVYFGSKAPTGKESNWVPTGGRDFEVLFRLYGPTEALFDKTWKLPDMEKVK